MNQNQPKEYVSAHAGADFSRRRANWLLVALAAFYIFYASCYIYRMSYVVQGQRYFCLFDDAMISMRYARNWVDGHGLVWNVGERVEGYSNFLWTAVMAGVHLLGLPDRLNSLGVQLICVVLGCGIIVGTYRLGRALTLSRAVSVGGSLVAGLYYPLTVWTLQGMEQGLLTCLLIWAAVFCAHSWHRGRFSAVGAILLAAALLTRADALVIVVGIWALFSLRIGRTWRVSTATLALSLAVWAAYWAWRWHYYESFWPNPYYLKLGIPLSYRLGVIGTDFISSTLYRLGVLFVGSLLLALFGLRSSSRWDLIGVFLLSFAYMWWVGGDAWPLDRFICPAMPFAALGLTHAYAGLISAIGSRNPRGIRAGTSTACAAVLAFSLNYAQIREWMQAQPYYGEANRLNIRRAILINEYAPEGARVAVFWAGVIPYFTHCYAIDVLGKSDRHVAREVPPALDGSMPPGHNKFDLRYSISELRADVVDMPGGTIWPDLTATEWFRREFHDERYTIDEHQEVLWIRTAGSDAR